jgi:hypothetical protein
MGKGVIIKNETLKEQDKMMTKLIFMENEAVHDFSDFHYTLPNKTQLDIITKNIVNFSVF